MKRLIFAIALAIVPSVALAQPYWGSYPDGGTLTFYTNTVDPTGAGVTITSEAIAAYDSTDTQLTTGVAIDDDVDSTTGFHRITIDTTQSGFSPGGYYTVSYTAGTVSGVSVAGRTIGSFSLRAAENTAGYSVVTIKDGTGTGEIDTTSGVVLASLSGAQSIPSLTVTTGGVSITNSSGTALDLIAGSNGHGLNATGSGSGEGMKATGGSSSGGHGFEAVGGSGAVSYGFYAHTNASGGGNGIFAVGSLTGAGLVAQGGLTGQGAYFLGGNTSGAGFEATAATSGNGATFTGAGNGNGFTLAGAGAGVGLYGHGLNNISSADVLTQVNAGLAAATFTLPSETLDAIGEAVAAQTDFADWLANGVSLADDAITSAKYDESTAFPIKSADTGDTTILRKGSGSVTGTSIQSAGTGSVSPFLVDDDSTWKFNGRSDITSPQLISAAIGDDSRLVAMDFTNPIPANGAISSITSVTFTNIAGTEPTIDASAISANRKKVNITLDCTAATAGTYTINVTIVTTDSQTFVRKGRLVVQ